MYRPGRNEDERGATIVEFALVASLLILIVFGLVDFGDTQNDLQSLRQGVRETARLVATQQPAATPLSTSDIVNSVIDRTGLPATRLRVDWTPEGSTVTRGNTIRVCVEYDVQALTGVGRPFLPDTVTSKVDMRVENDVLMPNAPVGPSVAGC